MGTSEEEYPDMEKVKATLTDITINEIDILGKAIELGDTIRPLGQCRHDGRP